MGRDRLLGVSLLAAIALTLAAQPVTAQTKEASGSVVAVSDTSLTIKAADKDMKFSVDNNTIVGAPGAGRATRDAQAKGAAGIKLTTILKPGSGVVVSYREAAGALVATEIRAVPAAASPAPQVASGTVKSVTDTSLVISDSGKDSTFAVDSNTRVLAKGAGTATQAAGGKIPVTKLIAVGDTVSISYEGTGQKMRASEVRVTLDASRSPRPQGR